MAGSKRPYRSPLRAAQADQTRELILDTVCEMVGQGRIDAVSMREIAAAAGVSERTVYRHFPDRRALLDRLAEWLSERLGTGPLESTLGSADELARVVPEVFSRFDAEADMARAAMLLGPDRFPGFRASAAPRPTSRPGRTRDDEIRGFGRPVEAMATGAPCLASCGRDRPP
jgi:AcrR family transcriptional regulator